jgi:hypothetical protein
MYWSETARRGRGAIRARGQGPHVSHDQETRRWHRETNVSRR